jgi:hypothetical protein
MRKVYDKRTSGGRVQRTVTVMGMNMLHHLGERGEDEDDEDEKHSDKGEAPLLQCGGHCRNCGSHINATAAANIYRQSSASGGSHSYSLLQAKVQILCDKALGRIKVSLALLWHIALNTAGKILTRYIAKSRICIIL